MIAALEFKPSPMTATILVFAVLVLILWRFAWGPLSKSLTDRQRKQEDTVKEAEQARAESERLLQEHIRQRDATAGQIQKLLDDAKRQTEVNSQIIVARAGAEAEAEGQRVKRDIASARDQALVEIWSQAAGSAVSVAAQVLSSQMNPDDHRRLVASAMDALPTAAGNGHGGYFS